MKTLVTVSIIALGLTVFAYNERQQRILLSQQVEQYDKQISQLLTQIEAKSVQRIQTERQLQSLSTELNSYDGQIRALSRQLELAQNQIDPDYNQMETQIRERLRREVQANAINSNGEPRVSLVRQLAEFDPLELAEVLSLNGQYGEFLRTLDVTDARMEVVIDALSNMTAAQNQARMDLFQQMQPDLDPAVQEDLQRKMQALHNPQSQREALSYDLTAAELDAFSEFQESRTASYNPFFSTSTSTSASGTIRTINSATSGVNFFISEPIESRPDQPRPVQLPPSQPRN